MTAHPVKDTCLGISQFYGALRQGGHRGKCRAWSQQEVRMAAAQVKQGHLWLEESKAPAGTSCLLELGLQGPSSGVHRPPGVLSWPQGEEKLLPERAVSSGLLPVPVQCAQWGLPGACTAHGRG